MAGLTVTNGGDRTTTCFVEVEFVGPDGVRLAEAAAVSNNLAPAGARR